MVIGKQTVEKAAANLQTGDKIDFQSVSEDAVVNLPEGVEVTNSTGKNMNINGTTVEAGETITVEKESTDPEEQPEPSEPETPAEPPKDTDTSSPQTGDDSNIALWIAVMLAAGAVLTGTAV